MVDKQTEKKKKSRHFKDPSTDGSIGVEVSNNQSQGDDRFTEDTDTGFDLARKLSKNTRKDTKSLNVSGKSLTTPN